MEGEKMIKEHELRKIEFKESIGEREVKGKDIYSNTFYYKQPLNTKNGTLE
jgi:hypothetical protein